MNTRSSPTRSSPRRSTTKPAPKRSRRADGRPPLPTQVKKQAVKKQQPKKKKATGKELAAAKQATEDKVAAASAAIKVKVKEEPMPKRRLWTEEEDEAVCKAYVNIAMDPTVGSQQKGDVFWGRVQKKMYELIETEAEVADTKEKWGYKSVESRLSKTIGKQTTLFNTYYLQMKAEHPSGWTEQMLIEGACTLFLKVEGKPFKFGICARILHGCPKFRPREDGDEDEDGGSVGEEGEKVKKNTTSMIQGQGLPKPMGTKAAKRKKIADLDSAMSTNHTEAIFAVARASSDLNRSFNKKTRLDSMHRSVSSYLALGDRDKAREILDEIEKIQKREEEDDRKPVPASINIQSGADYDEEEEEEQVEGQQEMTFKSVVDDPFDDGDQGDEDGKASLHSSHISDDSLAPENKFKNKKAAV